MDSQPGAKWSAALFLAGALVVLFLAGALVVSTDSAWPGGQTYQQAVAQVLPASGHRSAVSLGDTVDNLIKAGVIDRNKFEANYARDPLAREELRTLLAGKARGPIRLTRANAGLYVNLLWPLGLANRMESNSTSPINGPDRMNFASTGGWTLGHEANGGAYFNKFALIRLTPQQEAMVVRVAKHSFRPCCNNSTFFQDCNHGSALLGLLTLGASQGLGEQDLYREALAFNSFWFPDHAVHLALYFKAIKGTDWSRVDAAIALSADFSSASGMQMNIAKDLSERGLIPAQKGTSCSA